MKKTTKDFTYLGCAALIFYLGWGIPQFFDKNNILNPYINNWFFSVFFTGITGCLFPIIIRNKLGLEYIKKTKVRNFIIGIIVLIITLIVSIVFSDALSKVLQLKYTLTNIFKYVFLFIPMSFGLSIFAFLLIPRLIDQLSVSKITNFIISSILTGCFFFIGFFIDTTFGDIELAATMAILGILFAISNFLTKNFWLTFIAFFLTMLFNTLAENKYDEYPWIILFVSIVITSSIIISDLIVKIKKGQNNA